MMEAHCFAPTSIINIEPLPVRPQQLRKGAWAPEKMIVSFSGRRGVTTETFCP
jgi:hypothetical protein